MAHLKVGSAECRTWDIVRVLNASACWSVLWEKRFELGQWMDVGDEIINRENLANNMGTSNWSNSIHNFVLAWVGVKGSGATLKVLTDILIKNKLRDCAESLIKHFDGSINFKKRFKQIPSVIWNFIEDKEKYISIFFTPDIFITCEKFRENYGDNAIFSCEQYLRTFADSQTYQLQVVSINDIIEFNASLREGQKHSRKLVIVTGFEWEGKVRDILSSGTYHVGLGCDNMDWDDLSPVYQFEIDEKARNVLKKAFKFEADDILDKVLCGQVLVDLINNKPLRLFKTDTFPEDISYYIKRRIVPRNIISNKIFRQKTSDILLVSGFEVPELFDLTEKDMVGNSNDYEMNPDVRVMVLNEPFHFDVICEEKKSSSVHVLEKDGPLLKRKRSKGDVGILQQNQEKAQDKIWEQNFKGTEGDLTVIISDTPGMGKTYLLAKLGKILQKSSSDIQVIFVIFPELVRQTKHLLNQEGNENLKEKTEQALETILCANKLGQIVLKSKLKEEEKQFEILLHGFDEINSNDIDLALDILFEISSLKSIRIWVTTRPNYLEKLENKLNVLGCNILPLDFEEQVNFLKCFWISSVPKDVKIKLSADEATRRLECLAKNCFDILSNCLSEHDKKITGIPLQCLMVGLIFQKCAVNYLKSEKPENIPGINISCVTDLYRDLIERKFEIFMEKHEHIIQEKDFLMEAHAKLSFEMLFQDSGKMFEKNLPSRETILNVGIIESWEATELLPKFIHRAFAEYFAAWFLVEKMTSDESFWSQEVINFLFLKVLNVTTYKEQHSFHHPVVCHFLNFLLINLLKLKDRNLNVFKNNDIFLSDKTTIAKIYFAAVYYNYWGIYQFFDEINAFDVNEKEIFTNSLLKISVQCGSNQMFESVLQHFQNNNEFSDKVKTEILEEAIKRGDWSMLQYLLIVKGLDEQVKAPTSSLLHFAVRDTKDDDPAKLCQRKLIIKILYQQNNALLELENGKEGTPLVSKYVHIELLQELVKCGADVLAKDEFGDTVLHLASDRSDLPSDQFHQLLLTIKEKNEVKLKELFQIEGRKKDKLFITFLSRYFGPEPLKETLELAIQMGANITDLNRNGYSCLAIAIEYKRSIETFQTLLELGASLDWKHRKEAETLLHCAGFYCQPQFISLLFDLKEYKYDVNAKDAKGNTPLDTAVSEMHANFPYRPMAVESMMKLIRRGGTGKKASLTSVLHRIIDIGDEELLNYLIFEKNINVKKSQEQLPTKRIKLEKFNQKWGEDPFRIFFDLLQANVDMEAVGIDKKNILHVLMRKISGLDSEMLHSFVVLLVEKKLCHLFGQQDSEGKTPLYFAIGSVDIGKKTLNILDRQGYNWNHEIRRKKNLLFHAIASKRAVHVLESLVELGVDLSKVDKMGEGLLHACCNRYSLNAEAMKFLLKLQMLDLNINLKDKEGLTPLDTALLNYRDDEKAMMEIIVMLLKRGAEYTDVLKRNGHNLPVDVDVADKEALKNLEEIVWKAYDFLSRRWNQRLRSMRPVRGGWLHNEVEDEF